MRATYELEICGLSADTIKLPFREVLAVHSPWQPNVGFSLIAASTVLCGELLNSSPEPRSVPPRRRAGRTACRRTPSSDEQRLDFLACQALKGLVDAAAGGGLDIRMRAEIRWGELYAASEKNQGAVPGKTGRKGKPVLDPTPTLAKLGVTKAQAWRWQRHPSLRAGNDSSPAPARSGFLDRGPKPGFNL
jgi:hypothetical protein